MTTGANARGSREIAETLGFEPDNHHNALACPYCTGNGFWIATNTRQAGGRRVLGPFVSRDLALEVRVYVEATPKATRYGTTYWVFKPCPTHDNPALNEVRA